MTRQESKTGEQDGFGSLSPVSDTPKAKLESFESGKHKQKYIRAIIGKTI